MDNAWIVSEQLLGKALSDEQLTELGVNPSWLARSSGPVGSTEGLDLILFDRVLFGPRMFDFDHSQHAFPVATPVFTCCARDFEGSVVDVAAWEPIGTKRAMWLGQVPVVGTEWMVPPMRNPASNLSIFFSHLEWLQAQRRGVLVIDFWRAGPYLYDHGPFLVGSVEDGLALRKLLKMDEPKILVNKA